MRKRLAIQKQSGAEQTRAANVQAMTSPSLIPIIDLYDKDRSKCISILDLGNIGKD